MCDDETIAGFKFYLKVVPATYRIIALGQCFS